MIGFFIFFFSFLSLHAYEYSEKHISIMITSYNNINHYEKNLRSIHTQNYGNYDVYYIDDCSPDGTGQAVENYVKQKGLKKVHVIRNQVRQEKMRNIYNFIHTLPDTTIVVQVDGDDTLAHPNVLKHINKLYSTHDIWFTYGQCKSSNSDKLNTKPVPPEVIAEGSFRKYHWVYSHPHTFYAWLFKSIRLADLLSDKIPQHEGRFHPLDDVAFITPMVEMARYHFHWISEILYIFNEENPISHWSRIHNLCVLSTREVLQKNPYAALTQIPSYDSIDQALDIFIFYNSSVSDQQIDEYTKQIEKSMVGTGNCYFIQFNDPIENLYAMLELCNGNYILFATYPYAPQQLCDLSNIANILHKTHASAFYLEFPSDLLKNPLFKSERIRDTLCCWKYSCNVFAKEYLMRPILTLFNKEWILSHLKNCLEVSVEEFFKDIKKQEFDMDNVGLFFR